MMKGIYQLLIVGLLGIFGATVLAVDVALAKTTRHVVRSLDEEKAKIKLYFSLPKERRELYPAVVLMHDCSAQDAPWAALKGHAKYLNKLGFATVMVNSYSHRYDTVRATCGYRQNVYAQLRIYDAFAALEFLHAQPSIKKDAIGILGASQGGRVVLTAVSERSGNYRREGDKSPGFAAGVALYPPCQVAQSPIKPLLILIGEKDDWTLASVCYHWARQYQNRPYPPEVVIYPKTYHAFDVSIGLHDFMGHTVGSNPKALRDAQKRMGKFFQRHLQ